MSSDPNQTQGIRQDSDNKSTFFIEFAVKPNASRNRIYEDYGGSLCIAVNAPPTKGKANKAILKFLSKKLKIPMGNITLVTGQTSKSKIFQIFLPNISEKEIRHRLLT